MTRAAGLPAAEMATHVMADSSPLASDRNDMPLDGPAAVRAWFGRWQQPFILVGAIITLFAVVGVINPMFLSRENLTSLFAGNAYVAIAALGMSLIIICGHIDVSVGALIGVLAIVSGSLAAQGHPVWLAWSVPVVIGVLVNAFMGALVAYGRIPSIVVTLGMLSILKGGLISITGGAWISELPSDFLLARFRPFGIPSPIGFMVVLTVLAALWMRSSVLARAFYAVGSNAEAAQVVGVRTAPTVVLAFALHGGCAAVAAVLFATQMQVIQSTVPANLELSIIAAAVVGGVSILGGRGLIVGATLAAILFSTINSALIFLNVSAHWLRAMQALLILGTVLADLARRRPIR